MKKSTRIVKKLLALFLVVLMSIESFAAVVSDNDGSAFITKAEFDSLKNNFQSQIDQYNTSIDSKIDGAIASYLAGISVAKKLQQVLDPNCLYSFPLKMYRANEAFDIGDYNAVSVPKVNAISSAVKINLRDGNFWIDDDKFLETRHANISSYTTYNTNSQARVVFIGRYHNDINYAGQKGALTVVEADGGTRNIDGTNRRTYKIDTIGWGQYNILAYKQPDFAGSGGSVLFNTNGNANRYFYLKLIGYNNSSMGVTDMTAANGSKFNGLVWQNSASRAAWNPVRLQAYHTGTTVAGDQGVEDIVGLTDPTNVSDLITKWNNASKNSKPGNKHGGSNDTDLIGTLKNIVIDWDYTNKRGFVCAGTGFMPANLKNAWQLEPVPDTDAAKNLIVQHDIVNSGPVDYAFVRLDSSVTTVDCTRQTQHWFWPKWTASPNDNFRNEAVVYWSKLRASVVKYEDSNGKTHYMDEGMYLGHYDKEGKVEFVIKFNGNNGIRTNFALSKKPFGFNCSDADRIKFKFKVTTDPSATTIDIPTGGYGYIDTNYSIKVNVDDIEKGDELYMMWWPENATNYVALDSITDYYLETTG